MCRLLSCAFAGFALLCVAADDAKTNYAADAATTRDIAARKAFQHEWKVVSFVTARPMKKGQVLPLRGDVLKFEGVTLPNAIPP